jgi:hypothetical protein
MQAKFRFVEHRPEKTVNDMIGEKGETVTWSAFSLRYTTPQRRQRPSSQLTKYHSHKQVHMQIVKARFVYNKGRYKPM